MAAASSKYKLVIVESPAKAKTIGKFLGRGYKVEACNGHVRDLPKSQIGVDVEHNFEPRYITIRGRGEILEKIRKEARGASKVILATDPDREGEAISWHLANILKIDPASDCRVEFNEITAQAVKAAMKKPRPSTCSSWTRSRRAACSTAWSAIRSARCSGPRSARACPPGACSPSQRA